MVQAAAPLLSDPVRAVRIETARVLAGVDQRSLSFDLLADIRSGNFRDHRGRPISVATNTIPGICYVICDLTPTLKKALKYLQAEMTPDGQGYYGYHRGYRAYYEVIDYNKLLS